jgi:hypothetical protein
VVVYGEPGEVRRVELYEDLALAVLFATFHASFGLTPQATEDDVTSAYVVGLPGLDVYPIGSEDDVGPLELEDLTRTDLAERASADGR